MVAKIRKPVFIRPIDSIKRGKYPDKEPVAFQEVPFWRKVLSETIVMISVISLME
jgi:hypothetical protein